MDDTTAEPSLVLWKRHDLPGHEACRLVARTYGWEISGTALFAYERQACRLDYKIACDSTWQTCSAEIEGWVGSRRIDVHVVREGAEWRLDGQACPAVAGCLDIDLNFSPSTNLLPIRRLPLAVGQAATVRAAWLRFPSFALEPLEQTYTRTAEHAYRYESAGGRFVAPLTVDDTGLVVDYGEIWSREGKP